MLARVAFTCMLTLVSGLADAQPERDRLSAERAAANARYAEQERSCSDRFVVSSCLAAARKEQRLTLDRLHRAELALDDAERREAAARRRQLLQERATAREARTSEAPASASDGAHVHRAPVANPPTAAAALRPALSASDRHAAERRSEEAYETKARAAQARREAVERRNAERAREGKVAAPLPVPSAASAR